MLATQHTVSALQSLSSPYTHGGHIYSTVYVETAYVSSTIQPLCNFVAVSSEQIQNI
jgi:hypothetical protein